MSTDTPNAYCVVLGSPPTIVGPFATANEAVAHANEHTQKNPQVSATVSELVAPANCP